MDKNIYKGSKDSKRYTDKNQKKQQKNKRKKR